MRPRAAVEGGEMGKQLPGCFKLLQTHQGHLPSPHQQATTQWHLLFFSISDLRPTPEAFGGSQPWCAGALEVIQQIPPNQVWRKSSAVRILIPPIPSPGPRKSLGSLGTPTFQALGSLPNGSLLRIS